MPFSEVHEFYRIAYLRMEERMRQEEEEEKNRKLEEERQNRISNTRGPRKPWNPSVDVNQQKPSIPLSIDIDDFEELLEDGGLL